MSVGCVCFECMQRARTKALCELAGLTSQHSERSRPLPQQQQQDKPILVRLWLCLGSTLSPQAGSAHTAWTLAPYGHSCRRNGMGLSTRGKASVKATGHRCCGGLDPCLANEAEGGQLTRRGMHWVCWGV